MTGSLQIKKDIYYMVINLYGPDGKRKLKWISTGLPTKGNKKRAEKMLRDCLQEYEQQSAGKYRSDIRFADWVRHWLEEVRPRVDEVTWKQYEEGAAGHVLPYFDASGLLLCDVTRRILQEFIDCKRTNGRKDGKGGLSPVSLRHFRNVLNQSLKLAVRNDLIPSNPCDGLILPRIEHREFAFYTADQLQIMLDAVKDDPLYPLLRVAAIYGLRRSELLGLRWDSIDFKANTLSIKHTVVQHSTVYRKDKTKNASSRRTLPLTPDVRQLLNDIKATEVRNRHLCGQEYNDNAYIFKRDDGRPYDPDYVTRRFRELLAKHNLPKIRFHDLRHSCASIMIAQGFTLKDIQEWLGHANITMTANVYSHLDMGRKKIIAETLAGTLMQSQVLEQC